MALSMMGNNIVAKVKHNGEDLEIFLNQEPTFQDLAVEFADTIKADIEHVSIWLMPGKLMKYPFLDKPLTEVVTDRTAIKCIGTPSARIKTMDQQAADAEARRTARYKAMTARRVDVNRNGKKLKHDTQYTFHAIQPLHYLPNPDKSRRYLQRLANDPGIIHAMVKHQFSVGLLTEMNPAEHTTHHSKTLGLNRNRGEAIELRLRTDSYDGYRDYKVIRRTLCHELAHNVHSEHDRLFWDLTKQIEQEVERNDYTRGGHSLGGEEFYNPEDTFDDAHIDGRGWIGGEFVLGGTRNTQGLSSRDLRRHAAEERARITQEAEAMTDWKSPSQASIQDIDKDDVKDKLFPEERPPLPDSSSKDEKMNGD